MATRVPVLNVSMLDLTFEAEKDFEIMSLLKP
jgi:glyceraldehyde-3-phosphate dehydrogenase/erythrose-4-phosphate dehydrogenase